MIRVSSASAVIAFVCLAGCGGGGSTVTPATVSKIADEAGIAVPASWSTVYSEVAKPDGPNSGLYILRGPDAFSLPDKGVPVSAATAAKAIETHVPSRELGAPTGDTAQSFEWRRNNGTWRGVQMKTSNGWWLYLEQVPQPGSGR